MKTGPHNAQPNILTQAMHHHLPQPCKFTAKLKINEFQKTRVFIRKHIGDTFLNDKFAKHVILLENNKFQKREFLLENTSGIPS
jgi:hypothetical protein